MPGRIEHDPDVVLRLPLGPAGAQALGPGHLGLEVLHAESRWSCICWVPRAVGQVGGSCSVSSWNDSPEPPSGGLMTTHVSSLAWSSSR